ncbi:uncharacterized protein FIBRA_08064 [Fibroporia radiculosa]|uniref:Transcription activator of gluconeogenesis ERT1 n=1 Tax=Fibroporia radiculosa TaxID=599839 RepID=J4GGC3_9APHY|nr:uncharacterized protein FIBRA_08064 [Fibroporia radiculosa]CCM05828.1 predicted protein [Fibroporia radiculosa]
MATEQGKAPNGASQDHTPPHPVVSYPPQQFGAHYPPPGPYPPFYYAPAIQDGAHDPNAPSGPPPPAPYIMAYPPPPPGMIYAYPAPPPSQGYPPYAPGLQTSPVPRPKRKQVKMACTNCAHACKRCDEARPCERCVKYGVADSCVDGVRKERKKGIKRGPYKRKNRSQNGEQATEGFTAPANGGGESVTPPAPYSAAPEGYYSYYYPPGYVQPPHNGEAHPEGIPNGNGPHVPHPAYYPMPPLYAPFPPYPGAPVPYSLPPTISAPASAAVPATNDKPEQAVAPSEIHGESSGTTNGKGKKRPRAKAGGDGGTKTRKAKQPSADSPADSDPARGKDLHLGGQPEPGATVYSGMEARTMVAV